MVVRKRAKSFADKRGLEKDLAESLRDQTV
jgi:hypothetical protein